MIVALTAAPGSSGVTTTAVMLAAMLSERTPTLLAECDPTGGDIAAWAQLTPTPGWSTAISSADRNLTTVQRHAQTLPVGPAVMLLPSRAADARALVSEAAHGFAGPFAADTHTVVVADCGRMVEAVSPWVARADLTLLIVRQAEQSAPATVAIVDRSIEAFEVLQRSARRVGVVAVGAEPYPLAEVETVFGLRLSGTLPNDDVGAGLACGAWSVGRRARRTALARASGQLASTVLATIMPASDKRSVTNGAVNGRRTTSTTTATMTSPTAGTTP